jgi:hypothetical protein
MIVANEEEVGENNRFQLKFIDGKCGRLESICLELGELEPGNYSVFCEFDWLYANVNHAVLNSYSSSSVKLELLGNEKCPDFLPTTLASCAQ